MKRLLATLICMSVNAKSPIDNFFDELSKPFDELHQYSTQMLNEMRTQVKSGIQNFVQPKLSVKQDPDNKQVIVTLKEVTVAEGEKPSVTLQGKDVSCNQVTLAFDTGTLAIGMREHALSLTLTHKQESSTSESDNECSSYCAHHGSYSICTHLDQNLILDQIPTVAYNKTEKVVTISFETEPQETFAEVDVPVVVTE